MTRRTLAAFIAAMALAGCASPSASPAGNSSVRGSITVFAAASLTAPFTDIARSFERVYPGTAIRLSFAGSATLAAQIQEGAVGDVFASADASTMQQVVDAGLIDHAPAIFARNRLQIAVARGNPKHIEGLADLGRPGLLVLLCAAAVPCGRYAQQAIDRAHVLVKPASLEADVKSVVTKVGLGEADAGIVYSTDVRAAASTVQGVDIPDSLQVTAAYLVAPLRDSKNSSLARAFIRFVLDDAGGQTTLRHYGFLSP